MKRSDFRVKTKKNGIFTETKGNKNVINLAKRTCIFLSGLL